jgi:hypothetical protein
MVICLPTQTIPPEENERSYGCSSYGKRHCKSVQSSKSINQESNRGSSLDITHCNGHLCFPDLSGDSDCFFTATDGHRSLVTFGRRKLNEL